MKRSLRITALFLAVMIGIFSAAEYALASTITDEDVNMTQEAQESGEDGVEQVDASSENEEESEPESSTEETKKAKKKKKKKKKGNLDKYIGLDDRYLVIATAKKDLKVFRKMDKSSRVGGKFKKNNCIIVNTKSMKKGRNYKWVKVFRKGLRSKGYIPLDWVKLSIIDTKTFGLEPDSKKNRQRIKICQYGLPYIGTRFKLGGRSLTQGIDCSTFARQAFRNAGVMVPSDATAWRLSNCGKGISRSELKPGDMLFYPHNAKDRSIGHCAIYIGDGFIINASGHQGSSYPSGGIRFSKIDYRYPSAVKFRNIVGN